MAEQMYSSLGTYTPDSLIGGTEKGIVIKGITLAKNQGVVQRGTVLGKITASGLCKPVDNAQTDGTEVVYCILTDDVDTGSGAATEDFPATAYFSGVFNQNALIFGGDDTYADHQDKLRELGIFLKDTI